MFDCLDGQRQLELQGILIEKLDYTEDHRISLGCLGDVVMMQCLQDRPEIKNIILCLDNEILLIQSQGEQH